MKPFRKYTRVTKGFNDTVLELVCWPGVSKDIEALVQSCSECQKLTTLSREPLIQSPPLSYPLEKVAADLL